MINMFDDNKIKKTMTKTQLTITLILILFFTITGATYAYFAITITNNTTITGEAATVNLTLDVTKIFPSATSENTGALVPQLSESGKSNSPLASALKSGCVDGNQNIVCQVYKIDIQNIGGSATQIVDGEILFYSNSTLTTDISATMPNLRWKLITSADATTPTNSVLGTNADLVADANDDNVFANDITMEPNSSFTYYMIIWINETNDEQPAEPGNTYYAQVAFNSANGTGVSSAFTP